MTKQTKKALSIEPLSNRVLISEIDQTKTKTASGIYLPESQSNNKDLRKGKVIAVGKGKFDDGELEPMTVQKGDIVLFTWGDMVEVEGKEYFLVRESEISAIVS